MLKALVGECACDTAWQQSPKHMLKAMQVNQGTRIRRCNAFRALQSLPRAAPFAESDAECHQRKARNKQGYCGMRHIAGAWQRWLFDG